MAWAAGSVAVGAAMLVSGRPFWRAFGTQNVTWGVIDGGIAQLGQISADRKQGSATADVEVAHARQLRRLLWINTALDVLYVAGGVFIYRSRPHAEARRGHGVGVIVQGGFLFFFDLWHALRTPRIH